MKDRIIKVTDTKTGDEQLVQSNSLKRAVSFVVAERFKAETASASDVTNLVNAGKKVAVINPISAPPHPITEVPSNLEINEASPAL